MPTRVFGAAALALASFVLPAGAQRRPPAPAPWTVTVTPTLNPLPVGLCGAVRLAIIDAAAGDAPRNPAGYRVTIADFDLAVTAADGRSVVGQSLDERHWSVCACQGAPVGTVATITATYPANALAEKDRVPGVAAEATATVETGAAKGPTNPPGCPAPGAPALVKTGRGAPGEPLPEQPAPAGPRVAIGAPAPTGFRLLPSVPIIASLGWDSMPNAVTYTLWRAGAGTPPAERRTVSQAAAKSARDTIPDPRIVYRYTLVAHYADGSAAESPAVEFTSPPLANPSGFTAKDRGLGKVDFQWQAVDGAKRYRLDGPGMPGTGYYATGTSTSFPLTPPGANSWKLTALYEGNYADYTNPSVASAVVRVLPPHPTPWLSKNNGPGSAAKVQVPKEPTWACWAWFPPGELDSVFDPSRFRWLGEDASMCDDATGPLPDGQRIGLQRWVNLKLPLWGDPAQAGNEAVYGNAVDLGVGRRAQCAQTMAIAPFGIMTTCYATAHGIVPGQAGFNDFNTITNPDAGIGDDFILAMVISKDQTGSSFLVFLRDTVLTYGRLAQRVSLDTEGPKYMPHACLSCHGGKYNAQTRKVDGASFLPLDPSLLAFASPADQAAQEEKIRQINAMIQFSDHTSPVAAYIRGLYGNAWMIPGTKATADYVPQGWAAQAGFYRSVAKPYCAMCHLAAPADVNFATWSNFRDNAGRIKAAVCGAHTMPHAELQYKAFWTKDTGPIYTPGLLATTLGFPSCP